MIRGGVSGGVSGGVRAGAAQRGSGGGATSLYVDSVNGSNSNAGSAAAPWQTLAKAQATVTAGKTLNLVSGSTWREQFNPPADMSVGVSGSGAMPIIDGTDIVATTWTQPNVGTYANVWSISWTRAAPIGTEDLVTWADGVMMRRASSLADLQASGGFFADDFNTTTTNVYIKAASNPNSNGVVYELPKRAHAFDWYATAYTAALQGPMELKRCVGHYGAVSGGLGTLKLALLRDGGIHHMVTQGSLTEDCIATGMNPALAGIPFTAYRDVGAGFSHTFNRCLALFDGGASRLGAAGSTEGFYGHSSSVIDALTLTACATRGIDFGSAAATTLTVTNGYCEDPYVVGVGMTGATSTVSNMLVRETVGSSHIGGVAGAFQRGDSSVTGSVTHSAAFTFANALATTTGSMTITNCALIGGSGIVGSGSRGNPAVTYTVMGGDVQAEVGTSYTGDYNVFISSLDPNLGNFECNRNGSLIFSLTGWQSATGQDAHSVYAAQVDQYDGGANAFWLGVSEGSSRGPADGDFRVNPSARVYSGAGTAYIGTFPDGTLITLVGPQQHYNWNTRAVVAGPPSAYPHFPTTVAEMRTYLLAPTAWNFYTRNAGGTYDLQFSASPTYTFGGASQASWAALLAASGSTFTRATATAGPATAFYTNVAGALSTFAANTPRIGDAGLLYERGAFNLLIKSQQFDDWGGGVTTSADSVVAPDGTTTADALTFSGFGFAFLVMSFTPNQTHAYSSYAKSHATSGAAKTRLLANNNAAWGTSDYSTPSSLTASWSRPSQIGYPITAGSALKIGVGTVNSADGNADATCDGIVDFWGAQLEPGSTVSSYVTTTTARGERKADRLTLALGTTSRTITVTFDDNSTQAFTGKTGEWTLPAPSLTRPLIKRIQVA